MKDKSASLQRCDTLSVSPRPLITGLETFAIRVNWNNGHDLDMGTTSIHIPEWEGNTIHSCDRPPIFWIGTGPRLLQLSRSIPRCFSENWITILQAKFEGEGSWQVPGEIIDWTICRSRVNLNALLRLTPPLTAPLSFDHHRLWFVSPEVGFPAA